MWIPFWALNMKTKIRIMCTLNTMISKYPVIEFTENEAVHSPYLPSKKVGEQTHAATKFQESAISHTHKIYTSYQDRKPATRWSVGDARSAQRRSACHLRMWPRRSRQEWGWMASSGCMYFADQIWRMWQSGEDVPQGLSFLHCYQWCCVQKHCTKKLLKSENAALNMTKINHTSCLFQEERSIAPRVGQSLSSKKVKVRIMRHVNNLKEM